MVCVLTTIETSRLGENLCPGRRHLLGLCRDGVGLGEFTAERTP